MYEEVCYEQACELRKSNIIEQENSQSEINSYLRILAPIQFTLESCSGASQTDFINVLMVSPLGNNFYHFQNDTEIMQFNARAPHLHDFYELLIVLDRRNSSAN